MRESGMIPFCHQVLGTFSSVKSSVGDFDDKLTNLAWR